MPQPFEFPDAADFARLEQKVDRLTRMMEGARITPPDDWLPVKEAAEVMGVHASTIGRWIANGDLEARGAGKARRVCIPQSRRRARSSAVSS